MTGVQSISYELAAQTKTLGLEIEHTFVPAGGGGLALAVALGFEQLGKTGHPIPRVECVQPTGNDTIVTPLGSGSTRARAVDCTSLISGLQVSSVLDGDAVIAHCRASGGTGHLVTDEQAWQAQQRLAREEGLFCEPAGAVALAGVLNGVAAAQIDPSATIVCLITGSAFKDPPSLERMNRHCHVPMTEVDQLASVLERGGT
jgi:threonine synthase